MFKANDFDAVASGVGSVLGKLPGLENAAGLQYAKAAMRAKEYLESVKRQGQGVVKSTPDGTWNNVWQGARGLASGISAAHGAGLFGSGGGDFSATDAMTMGMPAGQAEVIGGGGFTYWDTDMPTDSWKTVGSSFNW